MNESRTTEKIKGLYTYVPIAPPNLPIPPNL